MAEFQALEASKWLSALKGKIIYSGGQSIGKNLPMITGKVVWETQGPTWALPTRNDYVLIYLPRFLSHIDIGPKFNNLSPFMGDYMLGCHITCLEVSGIGYQYHASHLYYIQ